MRRIAIGACLAVGMVASPLAAAQFPELDTKLVRKSNSSKCADMSSVVQATPVAEHKGYQAHFVRACHEGAQVGLLVLWSKPQTSLHHAHCW